MSKQLYKQFGYERISVGRAEVKALAPVFLDFLQTLNKKFIYGNSLYEKRQKPSKNKKKLIKKPKK